MKKILFALLLSFGLIACSSKPLPAPPPQGGYFLGNITTSQAENLLFDGVSRSQWTVVGKGPNVIRVNLQYRGYDFNADIQYTNRNYSILFVGVNDDKGNLKKAHEVYKKYVVKLNKIIQKVIAKNP